MYSHIATATWINLKVTATFTNECTLHRADFFFQFYMSSLNFLHSGLTFAINISYTTQFQWPEASSFWQQQILAYQCILCRTITIEMFFFFMLKAKILLLFHQWFLGGRKLTLTINNWICCFKVEKVKAKMSSIYFITMNKWLFS